MDGFHGVSILLPTPSAWRATIGVSLYIVVIAISTHALRMEGDLFLLGLLQTETISIHALRMEGDKTYL